DDGGAAAAVAADAGLTAFAPADGGAEPVAFTDLPAAPVLLAEAPPEAPDLLKSIPAAGAGPCAYEPEDGSLIPRNWLRPRFQWTAAPGHDLFELRLSVANQARPLVVYTGQPHYTMAYDVWAALAEHSGGERVDVAL